MFKVLWLGLSLLLIGSCKTKSVDLDEQASQCLNTQGVWVNYACLYRASHCVESIGHWENGSCHANTDLSPSIEKKIWIFWDKEEKDMPFFYRQNVEHMRKTISPGWELVFVNSSPNSAHYVGHYLNREELPESFHRLEDKIKPGTTKVPVVQSDMVRLALLAKYGGFWLDASILLNRSVETTDIYKRLETDPTVDIVGYHVPWFLAPKYQGGAFGFDNWFIGARKNSSTMKLWRDTFFHFWNTKSRDMSIYEHPMYKNIPEEILARENFDYLNQHAALRLILTQNPKLFLDFYTELVTASDDLAKREDGPLPMINLYRYSPDGTYKMVFGQATRFGIRNLDDLSERFRVHAPMLKFPSFTMRRFDPELKDREGYYGKDNLFRRLWDKSLWWDAPRSVHGFSKIAWIESKQGAEHLTGEERHNLEITKKHLGPNWTIHIIASAHKEAAVSAGEALKKHGGLWMHASSVMTKDFFASDLWKRFQNDAYDLAVLETGDSLALVVAKNRAPSLLHLKEVREHKDSSSIYWGRSDELLAK